MEIASLKNKLSKMNIKFEIINHNGYNKDVKFLINSLTFQAGFREGKTTIDDFCREICYDHTDQQMQRRFFDNFNQLLRYANS